MDGWSASLPLTLSTWTSWTYRWLPPNIFTKHDLSDPTWTQAIDKNRDGMLTFIEVIKTIYPQASDKEHQIMHR